MLRGKVVSCLLPVLHAVYAAVTASTPSLNSWKSKCSELAFAIDTQPANTRTTSNRAFEEGREAEHILLSTAQPKL